MNRADRLAHEREEVTALWSSLGRLKYADFDAETADALTAEFGDTAHRQQHIFDTVWSFDHLCEDARDRVDAAIALDYPELFGSEE